MSTHDVAIRDETAGQAFLNLVKFGANGDEVNDRTSMYDCCLHAAPTGYCRTGGVLPPARDCDEGKRLLRLRSSAGLRQNPTGLNRGGDRRVNASPYRIALTRTLAAEHGAQLVAAAQKSSPRSPINTLTQPPRRCTGRPPGHGRGGCVRLQSGDGSRGPDRPDRVPSGIWVGQPRHRKDRESPDRYYARLGWLD